VPHAAAAAAAASAAVQHVLLSLPGQAVPSPWFEQQGVPLHWWVPHSPAAAAAVFCPYVCVFGYINPCFNILCLDVSSVAPVRLVQYCVSQLCCSTAQASPAGVLLLLPNVHRTQPLGVLHDLLSPSPPQPAAVTTQQQQQQQQQQQCTVSAPATPWCLTVHYRNMPASLSNSWQNAGTAKDYFLSSLKVS
jgi:hypothetical protein